MNTKSIIPIIGLIAAVACSGCASMANGRQQVVNISSTPSGADVVVDGATLGTTPWSGTIPRATSKTIMVKKAGYADGSVTAEGKLSSTFWFGNGLLTLLFGGGLFSSTTDIATGSAYEYAPGSYQVTLNPGATR